MTKLFKTWSHYFLSLLILLFIISRLGYLNLPFYWDEAWSYAIAVFDMHNNGTTILPGSGNTELTRGHPLLFYFLASLWTKLFGTDLIAVHFFPLLLSSMMLVAVYIVTLDLFNKETAWAATILFALQAVFMAQSTMLLPEVMLALWTLLTVYAYFRKKWLLFGIVSVLLVMTKETGIVLIGTLFLDKLLLERFFNGGTKRPAQLFVRELTTLCIPVVVFAAFMILQKIRLGWYLYADHLSLATLDPHEIVSRIKIFSLILFFQHGRNIFFFLSIAALIKLLVKGSVSKPLAHLLLFAAVFITCYLSFSSINFFTTRYLLSILPFLIIPGSWLITTLLRKSWLKVIAISTFALLFTYYAYIGNQSEMDTSLAYKNTVLLQKQAVNYAESMHWQQNRIYSAFLMQYYLSVPDLGYLNNKSSPFMHISNKQGTEYDIYLFCSNEPDALRDAMQKDNRYFCIKRFENRGTWVEFYRLKNPGNVIN